MRIPREHVRSVILPAPAQEARALPLVAFLGLGAMGAAMATSLARAGFPLAVWNRTAKRASSLARLGARVAKTPRDCASGAAIVVTMLRDGAAVREVLLGEQGALAAIAPKALVIDMSTIGRAAAKEIAGAVTAAGARFVDAPVSGTVGPAERGELLGLVGGGVRDVARAQGVLRAMCKRIIHAGDVGQGQALKVIVNGLGAHHFLAFTSMLALSERAGLAREIVVDAFTSGAFASPSYLGKKGKVLARDYSPEFSLALTQKDTALAIDLEAEAKMKLPVLHEIARAIDAGVASGLGEEDLYAMEKYFAQQ